jgi:alpha-ribazole phosphatase
MHLIRTGKTGDGPWKRYVGQSDIPLCDKGVEALKELGREFQYPKVEMVYSSPLKRCIQTSEILFPGVYTAEAPGLMDMNLGEFEGKTFEELRDDEIFADWLKDSFQNTPPGGEETIAFTKRIIQGFSDIFAKMMEEKISNVAVVTHGGVIMTLLASIGLPKLPLHQWAVDNGCGYTVLVTPQMWMRDRAVEVFAHLPEAKTEDDMDVYGLYYND